MSTSKHVRWRDEVSQGVRLGVEHARNGRAGDIAGAENTRCDAGSTRLAEIEQVIVETLDGRTIPAGDFLHGQLLLYLVDNRSISRHRSVAEIAWVEERLSPDVKFVLVWSRRPVTLVRLSPARPDTLSVIDTNGELLRFLETAGRRKALLIDADAGTVVTADEESEVFSLGREIRVTDERGSDHVIDLGDLM